MNQMSMKQLKHSNEVCLAEDFSINNKFDLDGAIEALSGWTEMNNGRGNVSILNDSIKKSNQNYFLEFFQTCK